ncbi:ABC transporter substrate-binding protein [Beggiatoa leptomitoformis]|uniref:ABC transporter substrate-binding protein n=1 Tax=Beggiatoa leptomitoformis TaxID=288004 RepID=A0A2N9YC25_9GAMM|nr:ABC transporter substrate binding protein [Beggiatoa leptomitoformis]AUI68023.1 ABC transporter substrate-binding protein [Beggiatoa leptomitoformis]QGX03466.1 ABC transporter substrate-binding protein [Beggiatoa leptomitoformis]
MLKKLLAIFVISLIVMPITNYADVSTDKKILYIDSYHPEYEWSQGVLNGIRQTLAMQAPHVVLDTFYMDTKRNSDEAFIQKMAVQVRDKIATFKPDVVIACDDNAMKYVVMPYYKDADLPFVFCGVNWDASIYELPYRNVTGMVEIALIGQIIQHIRQYATGDRIGYLAENSPVARKNVEYEEKLFNIHYEHAYFVNNIEELKEKFIQLQTEVDMMIIDNVSGIKGLDLNKADFSHFVVENTKIPSGSDLTWNADYCLIALGKVAEEQGEWTTETALKILAGAKPSDIPIVQNKRGKLYINLKLGNKLRIPFNPALLKTAEIIH